jgi:hypothetical protein
MTPTLRPLAAIAACTVAIVAGGNACSGDPKKPDTPMDPVADTAPDAVAEPDADADAAGAGAGGDDSAQLGDEHVLPQNPVDTASDDNSSAGGDPGLNPGLPSGPDERMRPGFIFNRVLVKTKDGKLSPAAVQELAEKVTGQKVARVRRTAGTFWLIEFEGDDKKPRDIEAQKRLVRDLDRTGAFAIVEGDQLMQLR